jgi:gas vesicle protein
MVEERPLVCAAVNTGPARRARKVLAEEYQHMNEHTQEHRDYGFVAGLLTGTFVGAGLAIWFAPRVASELRERVTTSARRLGQRASDQYEQVSTRVDEAVADLTRKGQDVRDEVADAVARGAHEVERYATAAKSDRQNASRKHSAADRSASKPHSL